MGHLYTEQLALRSYIFFKNFNIPYEKTLAISILTPSHTTPLALLETAVSIRIASAPEEAHLSASSASLIVVPHIVV